MQGSVISQHCLQSCVLYCTIYGLNCYFYDDHFYLVYQLILHSDCRVSYNYYNPTLQLCFIKLSITHMYRLMHIFCLSVCSSLEKEVLMRIFPYYQSEINEDISITVILRFIGLDSLLAESLPRGNNAARTLRLKHLKIIQYAYLSPTLIGRIITARS